MTDKENQKYGIWIMWGLAIVAFIVFWITVGAINGQCAVNPPSPTMKSVDDTLRAVQANDSTLVIQYITSDGGNVKIDSINLPNATGISGQVLKTDGSGVLTFENDLTAGASADSSLYLTEVYGGADIVKWVGDTLFIFNSAGDTFKFYGTTIAGDGDSVVIKGILFNETLHVNLLQINSNYRFPMDTGLHKYVMMYDSVSDTLYWTAKVQYADSSDSAKFSKNADSLNGQAPAYYIFSWTDSSGGSRYWVDSAEHADSANHSDVADSAFTVSNNVIDSNKIINDNILFRHFNQNGASSGQIPKWNGSDWTASNDQTGAGLNPEDVEEQHLECNNSPSEGNKDILTYKVSVGKDFSWQSLSDLGIAALGHDHDIRDSFLLNSGDDGTGDYTFTSGWVGIDTAYFRKLWLGLIGDSSVGDSELVTKKYVDDAVTSGVADSTGKIDTTYSPLVNLVEHTIEDSLDEYSLTSAISSTYETISNVALIGDDTTNFKIAYDSSQHDYLRSNELPDSSHADYSGTYHPLGDTATDFVSKTAGGTFDENIKVEETDSTARLYVIETDSSAIQLRALHGNPAYTSLLMDASNADFSGNDYFQLNHIYGDADSGNVQFILGSALDKGYFLFQVGGINTVLMYQEQLKIRSDILMPDTADITGVERLAAESLVVSADINFALNAVKDSSIPNDITIDFADSTIYADTAGHLKGDITIEDFTAAGDIAAGGDFLINARFYFDTAKVWGDSCDSDRLLSIETGGCVRDDDSVFFDSDTIYWDGGNDYNHADSCTGACDSAVFNKLSGHALRASCQNDCDSAYGLNTMDTSQWIHLDMVTFKRGFGSSLWDTIAAQNSEQKRNNDSLNYKDTIVVVEKAYWNNDSAYVDSMAGWDSTSYHVNHKWPFWSGLNYFPYNRGIYENPVIRASFDKYNWVRPYAIGINLSGDNIRQIDTVWARDPVYDSSYMKSGACTTQFLTDPFLSGSDDGAALWLGWRSACKNYDTGFYDIVSSSNGIGWDTSTITRMFEYSQGDGYYMSPVINMDTGISWEMWYVCDVGGLANNCTAAVCRITCPKIDTNWYTLNTSDIDGYYTWDTTKFTSPGDSSAPWHIDVTSHPLGGPERWMLSSQSLASSVLTNKNSRLYYSDSLGIEWVDCGPVIPFVDSNVAVIFSHLYKGDLSWEYTNDGWQLFAIFNAIYIALDPAVFYLSTFKLAWTRIHLDGMADDEWIGLEKTEGRIVFDDAGSDTVRIEDAIFKAENIIGYNADIDTLEADTLTVDNADIDTLTVNNQMTINGKTITGDKHFIFNLFDPDALYAADHEICITPRTDAALTITRIDVTLDADPTTELEFSIKWADAFIGFASAAIIDDTATVAGVTTVTGGFNDATVPANKCIYFLFDADPDDNITQASIKLTFDYD